MADTRNCIFCKIVAGDLPSTQVYSDDLAVAFNDIRPVAPRHVLLVPREHIEALAATAPEQAQLLGHLLRVAPKVAKAAGILDSGYRIAINQGMDAGQIVDHLHLHVIGGRHLGLSSGLQLSRL